MLINKDIIIRLVSSFIFFAVTARVLGPILFSFLKNKMPGQYSHNSDIDSMIRRQKDRLQSQYGLPHEKSENPNTTLEIHAIYKEADWGGGKLVHEIKQEISKTYSYTIADSKINAFLLICKKKNYLNYLSSENSSSTINIKNYLMTFLLMLMLIEELREKKFFILERIARKLTISTIELALALQIKLLIEASLKKELKEDRIFSELLVINQYSEETISGAYEHIAKKEANLWAKSPSLFFEELTLVLNYASIITPLAKLKNRKDLDTAYQILGVTKDQTIDEIKKCYKKIALSKHPDKIVSQKLPKVLERKAIERFNQIQEAYEVIMAHKK